MPPKKVASQATRKPVVKSKAKRGGRVGVGGGGESGHRKANARSPLDESPFGDETIEDDDDNTSNVGESFESENKKVRELIALLNANMRRYLVIDESRHKFMYLDTPISSDLNGEAVVIEESDESMPTVLYDVFAFDPDIDVYCVKEHWNPEALTLTCEYRLPLSNRHVYKKDDDLIREEYYDDDDDTVTCRYFVKDYLSHFSPVPWDVIDVDESYTQSTPATSAANNYFAKVTVVLRENDSMTINYDNITLKVAGSNKEYDRPSSSSQKNSAISNV